ncbi:MAG: TIGR04283 family arsenosugar biosynthesis glycosyltransferase [Blastocatellales bacterium]
MKFSIIIPTLNEAMTIGKLAQSLINLCDMAEIIVADGGSADETVRLASESGLRVIEAPRGRGRQMNAGAKLASGDVLIFLHADTRLPDQALAVIEAALDDEKVCGGNFSLIFDGETRQARLLTRIYPLLRLGGMCYGDSAIFVRREIFESLGGYRDYPIFEDCDLYRRMRRVGKFVRLPAAATTSSRRFEGRFIRTFALWATMQVLYWLGVDPNRLERMYKPLR